MEQGLFGHVLDAAVSLLGGAHGPVHGRAHGRGVKLWIGDADGAAAREHYEAQLVRLDGEPALEIGFHAEHRDPTANTAVLDHLLARESSWRTVLGDTAEAGTFLGMNDWTRVSEVWEPPDPDDPDAPMEIAARLVDYVEAIEPVLAPETDGASS